MKACKIFDVLMKLVLRFDFTKLMELKLQKMIPDILWTSYYGHWTLELERDLIFLALRTIFAHSEI